MIVQSVQRALMILNLFSHQVTRLGITEISEILGITKGAVHGLVNTLVEAGFLLQEPETRKYRLGLKAIEIGMMQPDAIQINRCAIGPANSLAHAKNMLTRVGLWDGEAVMVIATYYPQYRPEISSSFGPRVQAYASSLGKAILAHRSAKEIDAYLEKVVLKPFTASTITDQGAFREELKRIREQRYAVDREEAAYGTACLGAPVFNKRNEAIGALSISGPADMILAPDKMEGLSRALLGSAGEISRALEYS